MLSGLSSHVMFCSIRLFKTISMLFLIDLIGGSNFCTNNVGQSVNSVIGLNIDVGFSYREDSNNYLSFIFCKVFCLALYAFNAFFACFNLSQLFAITDDIEILICDLYELIFISSKFILYHLSESLLYITKSCLLIIYLFTNHYFISIIQSIYYFTEYNIVYITINNFKQNK